MLRSLIAALAALAFLAPAAFAAPWSDPAPVPGAPDAFPTVVPARGGMVAWNAVIDDPAGQVSGAVVTERGVAGPARTLRDLMTFTGIGGYGNDRLAAGGTVMRSGVARAAVATGTTAGGLGTPGLLATGGAVSTVRALAANHVGDIAVVTSTCTTRACGTRSLALFFRRRGGATFRKVASLASAGTQVRDAEVAINERGDVIAAWENRRHVYARTRTAGGELSTVQRLGDGIQSKISVDISAVRRTIVAWSSQRVSEGEALSPFVASVAYKGPDDKRFHTAREVGRIDRTGTGRYVDGPGVRASVEGFRATVAFTTIGADGRYAVAVRDLDPVGRPKQVQRLSPFGADAILGDMAAESDDRVVLYVLGRAGADPVPGAVSGVGARTREGPAAAFGSPETVSSGGAPVDTVSAELIDTETIVAWRAVGEPIHVAWRESTRLVEG